MFVFPPLLCLVSAITRQRLPAVGSSFLQDKVTAKMPFSPHF